MNNDASNNENTNHNDDDHLGQELNLQTLQAYLPWRFPNLEPASDDADMAKALRALLESGRKTVRDVDTLIDEQISIVVDVISDLNGAPRLATSIIRMSLFAATPDPEQLTAYNTSGSSISSLVESIERCRARREEAVAINVEAAANGAGTQGNDAVAAATDGDDTPQPHSASAQALQDYLQRRFPSRPLAPGEFDYASALYVFQVAGVYTWTDIDSLLDRQMPLIESIESYAGPMNVQDIIRYSLVAEHGSRLSPGPFIGGISTINDMAETIRRFQGQTASVSMAQR